MTSTHRSTLQIVEEQVRKWQLSKSAGKPAPRSRSVVTVSREPGSGGRLVAQQLAEQLGYDLFHQEVIHEMAKSARVSNQLMETLDEKGFTVLDDWISSLVDGRHLWPDKYLQHLMKVIGTLGRHGNAVLVGRGANFVLPPERRLSLRVIAPRGYRIRQVSATFDVDEETARRRIIRTESDRRAFVRRYFNADIADPANYDLVINSGSLGIDAAAEAVMGALKRPAVSLEQVA